MAGAETWLCDGTRISCSKGSESQCGFPMDRRGCAAGSCNGPRDACMSVGDRKRLPGATDGSGCDHWTMGGSQRRMDCIPGQSKARWLARRRSGPVGRLLVPLDSCHQVDIKFRERGVEIEEETTASSRTEADSKRPNWCLGAAGRKLEVGGTLPGFPHTRHLGMFCHSSVRGWTDGVFCIAYGLLRHV